MSGYKLKNTVLHPFVLPPTHASIHKTIRPIQTSIHHHTLFSQGTDLSTHGSIIKASISTHTFIHVWRKEKAEQRFAGASEVNWQDQKLPCFPAHMPSVKRKARALCNPTCISLSCSLLCLCTLCKINHINTSSLIIAVKNVIINIKWQMKAASIHCLPFHFSIPSP